MLLLRPSVFYLFYFMFMFKEGSFKILNPKSCNILSMV